MEEQNVFSLMSVLFSTVSLAFLLMADGVVNNKFSKKHRYPFILNGCFVACAALLVIFEVFLFKNKESLNAMQIPVWVAQIYSVFVACWVIWGGCLFVKLPYSIKADKIIVIVLIVAALIASGTSRAMLLL